MRFGTVGADPTESVMLVPMSSVLDRPATAELMLADPLVGWHPILLADSSWHSAGRSFASGYALNDLSHSFDEKQPPSSPGLGYRGDPDSSI